MASGPDRLFENMERGPQIYRLRNWKDQIEGRPLNSLLSHLLIESIDGRIEYLEGLPSLISSEQRAELVEQHAVEADLYTAVLTESGYHTSVEVKQPYVNGRIYGQY